MANQTSVTPDLATMPPSPGSMVGNIAEFGNDIATLVELQAKLAALDAKDCVGRATWPLVFLIASVAVALSCLPVLLFGLAELLHALAPIPFWACLLIVGLTVLAGGGLVAFFAYKAAFASITSFRRSTEEFTRNLSWVRTVLVHSGRSVARPKV